MSYNNAVSDLSNELALLNVARAEQGLPLHYSGFSRLSGSFTVSGTTSLSDGIKLRGKTATTNTDALGAVSSGALAVATGGSTLTPMASATVSTGPTFDIDVLDTQEFYQGILADVPFQTVETFLDQGDDEQLLMNLLVERVDVVATKGSPSAKPGYVFQSLINNPETVQGYAFHNFVLQFHLTGTTGSGTQLGPFSRVDTIKDKVPQGVDLKDFASLDGKALDLSQPLTKNTLDDTTVMIVRPASGRSPKWAYAPSSSPDNAPPPDAVLRRWHQPASFITVDMNKAGGGFLASDDDTPLSAESPTSKGQAGPAAGYVHVSGKIQDFDAKGDAITCPTRLPQNKTCIDHAQFTIVDEKAAVSLVFRSPEGMIRYLGAYLRATESLGHAPYTVGCLPIFQLKDPSSSGAELVSATLLNRHYALAEHPGLPVTTPADCGVTYLDLQHRNLQVLGLIEELVNLQKKASDRPATVPVQVVH